MYEGNVDGGPAAHEGDGVDELQLGAGDDGRNHQEHGHDQDNHGDDDGNLEPILRLELTTTMPAL
jgi:hypothetical protein